jgi:hypothetical protein
MPVCDEGNSFFSRHNENLFGGCSGSFLPDYMLKEGIKNLLAFGTVKVFLKNCWIFTEENIFSILKSY